MIRILRAVAVLIAVAGVLDPPIRLSRPRPVPVDIRLTPSRSDPHAIGAARVRQDLLDRMAGTIEASANTPAAVVAIGGAAAGTPIGDGVPVAVVSMEPAGRNVAVLDVRAPAAVVAGQRVNVSVALHARGATGETSTIVLERDGLELARATYQWNTGDERATVNLTCAPPGSGVVYVRARVAPIGGEGSDTDNVADVGLRVVDRPLRVLAWEPRPSWAAAFVRRALEADPAFDVASLVRSSRGLDTRSGAPPSVLSAGALAPFDAMLVGAPEELNRRDVDAIETFVRVRGGAVIFLPDRLPEGEYRRLLPAARFEELLLDRPATLEADGRARYQASEFAIPSSERGETLASLVQSGAARPVVVSWPTGAGLTVFSGALDGWRFRGADGEPFGAFWTAAVAAIALESPARLSVSVEPSYAAPGDRLTIRARVRATDVTRDGDQARVPSVRADVVAADGHATAIRLWPSAATGVYETTMAAPSPGRFDVRVSGEDSLTADAPLLISAGARTGRFDPVPAWLVAATGGVGADASDLASVDAFLRALSRPAAPIDVFPMRSAWWVVPFASALCAEWALRRRKGLR